MLAYKKQIHEGHLYVKIAFPKQYAYTFRSGCTSNARYDWDAFHHSAGLSLFNVLLFAGSAARMEALNLGSERAGCPDPPKAGTSD